MKLFKKELFILSSNNNKITEIKKIFSNQKYKFYTLKKFKKINMPKETGKTFKKNATIKSKFGYKISNMPCIADDSGICIAALNGGPGVKSNRYKKKLGGNKNVHRKILKEIKKKKNNKANFKTVISFTFKKNKTVTFEGSKIGTIVAPVGKKGFDYDPIFKPHNSNKTYAQMSKKEKNKISHRAIAMKKFINFINNIN